MYIKFMANSYSSPASLKNYLSGAKYWVITHGGDPSAFFSVEVAEMTKAVVAVSQHVPSPAAPLLPSHVHVICKFLDAQSNVVKAIKPCILLTFACMLRSSNVLCPNLSAWAGAHTLVASDVILTPTSLKVIIRSTKSTCKKNPVLLTVLSSPLLFVCPVKAWRDYYLSIRPSPLGPAFVTIRLASHSCSCSSGDEDCPNPSGLAKRRTYFNAFPPTRGGSGCRGSRRLPPGYHEPWDLALFART